MRRATSLMLSLVVVPAGVLAAPVTSRPAPDARPVAPHVQDIALDGVVAASAVAPTTGPRTVALTAARTTAPFETFGVTWAQDAAVGEVVVHARTRTEGVWTPWTELDEEAGAAGNRGGDATQRAGTEPAWVGPSDGVQVRVEVLSGAAPTDVRLSLVDPGESPADATVSPTLGGDHAQAATSRPVIRSREDWGADETIRSGSPSYASSLYAVTVHHTASSNSYAPEDVPGILRSFYAYHVKSRGWSDIGYNVIVDKYGNAWEGRAGGLDKPVIGAHAGGFNTGTVGVSIIGTYDTVAPTSASLEKVAQVAAWKLSSYGRDPKGTVTLTSGGSTKYAAGTKVTLPRIFGHKDVSSTACPGVEGYAALPEVRDRAAALVAAAPTTAPSPDDQPTPVPGDSAGEEADGTTPTTPTTSPTPTPTPTATPKPPFGALEQATGGTGDVRVRGWAIDPDASTYTSVAVSVDGTVAKTFVANVNRPDVATANPPYSPNHGFEGTVPAAAGTRTVCATAKNQGSGADVQLGCRTATVGAAATPAPTSTPTPAPGPVPASSTAPPPARSTDDSCPSGRVPASSFRDTAGSVHAPAIDCAVWWQITGGTSPSSYAPTQGVTRAQMASFLARTILRSGGSLPSAPPDAFSDDASTGAHQQAINQLAAVGVVTGKGGRTYDPTSIVRRDQMATFLVRAYQYRTSRTMAAGADYFADDNGNVHEVNIGKVAKAGFTGGSGDGRFRPGASTDRGQMASFLTRVLDLLVEAGDAPERT